MLRTTQPRQNRPRASYAAVDGAFVRFDNRLVIKHSCELLPWLVASFVLPQRFDVILFLGLAVWIFFGNRLAAVKALTVSFLLMHVNWEVFGMPSPQGMHILLPFLCLGKLLLSPITARRLVALRIVQVYAVLMFGVILHSFVFSVMPAVSVLKVVSFTTYFAATVGTISNAGRQRDELRHWFTFVVAAVVVLNLPLMLHPAGRFRNGFGLNGMLNHPNALGVFLAVGIARLTTQALAARTVSVAVGSIMLIALYQLFKSEARGGLLAFVFSVGLWAAVGLWRSQRLTTRILSRLILISAVLVPVTLVFSESLVEQAKSFVSKSGRSRASGLLENFQRSRGGAIEQHLAAFREHPLGGRGFQVVDTQSGEPSDVVFDPIFHAVPISAAVENGFLYSSVLAEGGLIGAPLMYGFIIALAVETFRRRGGIAEAIVPIAVLLVNVTEATLFSPSGVGGWCLLLIGLAITPQSNPAASPRPSGVRVSAAVPPRVAGRGGAVAPIVAAEVR